MKNYDKKQALAIICSCAKSYEEKLNNKHFLIVYRDKNVVKECCVGFRDMNFLHLTGINTKMSAQQFYSACLNGKLSLNDINIDTKGKVQQKLSSPTCKVLAIFSKEYDAKHFNVCTYLSKGYTVDSLPDNLKVKLEYNI